MLCVVYECRFVDRYPIIRRVSTNKCLMCEETNLLRTGLNKWGIIPGRFCEGVFVQVLNGALITFVLVGIFFEFISLEKFVCVGLRCTKCLAFFTASLRFWRRDSCMANIAGFTKVRTIALLFCPRWAVGHSKRGGGGSGLVNLLTCWVICRSSTSWW